jgi:hypothetical protein
MDSEVDFFFPTFWITQNSVETGFKNKKKGRSAHTTWIHIRTARDGEDFRFKFYIYCTETSSYSTLINTNIQDYFELKHRIIIDRTSGPIQIKIVRQL